MAASGIHLVSEFKYEQQVTLIDYFDDIMRALFNQKESQKHNFSGKSTLLIDRGYLRITVFQWGLEIGRDFLATVMRNLGLYLFLFGKKTRKMSTMTGMRRNLNLSLLTVSNFCIKKSSHHWTSRPQGQGPHLNSILQWSKLICCYVDTIGQAQSAVGHDPQT